MAEAVEEKKPAPRTSRANAQPKVEEVPAVEAKVEEAPVEEAPVKEAKVFKVRVVGPGALMVRGGTFIAGHEVEVTEADYKLTEDEQKKIFGVVLYEAI